MLSTIPHGPSPLAVGAAALGFFPSYQPQLFCDPTPKPGTAYLAHLALSYFGQGHLAGISRACTVGGRSEHKEGRAFDWAVSVDVPAQKAAGDAFVQWLTAVGPDGKVGYNARQLGVMYIIWNRHIWLNTSADAAWRDYHGPSPHTDHVHVSLTWAGAYERTPWYGSDPGASRDLPGYLARVWAGLVAGRLDETRLDDGWPDETWLGGPGRNGAWLVSAGWDGSWLARAGQDAAWLGGAGWDGPWLGGAGGDGAWLSAWLGSLVGPEGSPPVATETVLVHRAAVAARVYRDLRDRLAQVAQMESAPLDTGTGAPSLL
ncbi:hypothetical protein Q6346_00680 [Isoptericola sp. b490]|uniref:hypothetical protein n=1 Tax=Actinotalea lenta TaxID=3064654 RepID=UPI0027132CAC|nr:hypothetical protein [Isoptericola sp. b490]MDO8119824.1 hypothetical protein [Isoptericola sp. b490]